MAVIVSNGTHTISDANAFYNAEAYNITSFNTTRQALSTTRYIPFTPANNSNLVGVIIPILEFGVTSYSKTVTLQENVATIWTDRTSATLTYNQLTNSTPTSPTSDMASKAWAAQFEWASPYAVTALAATWRFKVTSSGGGSETCNLYTSDATNLSFITYSDTLATFADNDTMIVRGGDTITINKTCTFGGTLGTGMTDYGVAIYSCRNTTPDVANVANVVWENPAVASYTMTIKGMWVMSGHSGFRVGTAANPISFANRAVIVFGPATSGVAIGWCGINKGMYPFDYWSSLFFYGEKPTYPITTLSADAAYNQKVIVTTDTTGWGIGDVVSVGRADYANIYSGATYTIANIAGTTITLNNNLDQKRLTGGKVVKYTGYGIKISGINYYLPYFSNMTFSGVEMNTMTMTAVISSAYIDQDISANSSAYLVEDCSVLNTTDGMVLFSLIPAPPQSWTIQRVYGISGSIIRSVTAYSGTNKTFTSGIVTFQDNYRTFSQTTGGGGGDFYGSDYSVVAHVYRNVYENGTYSPAYWRIGTNCDYADNKVWGFASSIAYQGGIVCGRLLNGQSNNDSVDKSNYGLGFYNAQALFFKDNNSSFGTAAAITVADVNFNAASYYLYTLSSPTGNLNIPTSGLPYTLPGSQLRISDFNDTPGDDRDYLPLGLYQRTGTGLTDTTCRTAGGYALRMQPITSTSLLAWPNLELERGIPTGNIQNKTMTVSAWVYINNATYYAGTHAKPTMNLTYDTSTTVTAVATASAGAWQLLSITFTPATTAGQILLWFTGMTDATGANAYFYIDDLSILYPSGYSFNLGALDLWSNATPVWPPIATVPMAGSVWDEATSAHTASGSFGELTERTEVKVDDAGVLKAISN